LRQHQRFKRVKGCQVRASTPATVGNTDSFLPLALRAITSRLDPPVNAYCLTMSLGFRYTRWRLNFPRPPSPLPAVLHLHPGSAPLSAPSCPPTCVYPLIPAPPPWTAPLPKCVFRRAPPGPVGVHEVGHPAPKRPPPRPDRSRGVQASHPPSDESIPRPRPAPRPALMGWRLEPVRPAGGGRKGEALGQGGREAAGGGGGGGGTAGKFTEHWTRLVRCNKSTRIGKDASYCKQPQKWLNIQVSGLRHTYLSRGPYGNREAPGYSPVACTGQ